MNKKAVQWLHKELPDLVSKGILSQSAADKLSAYYGDVKSSDKKWLVIILCSVLGAVLIGLGIILLFAHNWEDLSRPMRAVLSLLLLIIGQALAMWVVLKRPESHALKEATAIFLSLMVGASTALISQTYNIPGDTPSFILTWMLLVVPLTYLMKATIPAAIFVAGVSAWSSFFRGHSLEAYLFWPLLAIVIPHFIWSLRQEKYTIRATILALVMAVSICFGANSTLGKFRPGLWIVIYSSLATGFYFLGSWEFKRISTNWQRPFQLLGGLGVFIMTFLLTFRFPWEMAAGKRWHSTYDKSSWAAIPDYVLTFLLVAVVLLFFYQYVKKKDWMRALFGALPLLALIGYAFSGRSVVFPVLLFNIFLLAVSIFRLMIGIRTNNLSIINTSMIMLSALVLARFFDSEINFILKGLIFIFIGVCFLATNVVILRRKAGAA